MNKVSELDKKIIHALSIDENKVRDCEFAYENLKTRLMNEGLFSQTDYGKSKNNNKKGWRLTMKIMFTKKSFSLASIILIIAVCLSITGFTIVNAKNSLRTDKIDYPFIDDTSVIGKWQSVDFVKTIDQFSPDKKGWRESLYLKELVFIDAGKMLGSTSTGNGNLGPTSFTWTKGIVLNSQSKTASKYVIKDIEGATYMFFEWKSGDYTIRGLEPRYYVLKKIDSQDYSKVELKKTIDKIDYPFVEDQQVLGNWEAVDFVDTIKDFSTTQSKYNFELYLKKLIFKKNGELTQVIENNNQQSATWTSGLVLNKNVQTASKYEVKEINGETYLFYEWKSGDYIYRGLQPSYYVLKKIK